MEDRRRPPTNAADRHRSPPRAPPGHNLPATMREWRGHHRSLPSL